MGYKEEKEAFVSNLNGTSMGEIALVSCLLPAGLFLRASLWRAIGITAVQRLPAAAIWLVEFATVAMPPLLSLVAPEQVPAMTLGAVMLGSGLSVVAGECGVAEQARRRQLELRAASLSAPRKYHIAVFRATMMLTTCVCILAVDFHVFPRRFAKVETYGTGVMDIGVGAFVFANGLVSPAAASRKGVVAAMRSAGPLLLLGAGRLVSIKASGYPEHVSEYGVHWNFFLTLAAVSVPCHSGDLAFIWLSLCSSVSLVRLTHAVPIYVRSCVLRWPGGTVHRRGTPACVDGRSVRGGSVVRTQLLPLCVAWLGRLGGVRTSGLHKFHRHEQGRHTFLAFVLGCLLAWSGRRPFAAGSS